MSITYIDPNESRDRRIQMLLQTANNMQDIQMRKQVANQEQEYRIATLAQNLQQNKATSQLGFAKLGYGPATPQSINEQNMVSNPNRGATIGDAFGQQYTPNPQLMKAKQTKGIPRFVQDEEGNFVELPGILTETPQQKLDRKNVSATADSKNKLQANQDAFVMYSQLKKLSGGLESIGGYQGIAVKGGNLVTRGKLNPEAKAYMDFMPAAGVSIYRGVTGDTRLSDADAAARAYPLMWDIDEDGNVKKLKEGAIEKLLTARNLLLSNNIYATKEKDKITSLEDTTFVVNALEQGATEDQIMKFLKSKRKS